MRDRARFKKTRPVDKDALFCDLKDVNFTRTYNNSPTVILTAKHSSGGGNASPDCNGIVSWIEVKI